MKKSNLIVAIAFALSTLISAPVAAAGVQGKADTQGTVQMHNFSDLIGKHVVGENGESLGKVENVIIGRDGEAKYLLLSKTGVPESGENLVAVPWSMVKSTSNDTLALNISKDKIDKAPTFSKDTTFNRDWENKINAYYGTEKGVETTPETSGKYEEQGEFHGKTGAFEVKEFLGKSVVDTKGEKLGDLQNIIIDQSGRLKYAIISTGGFLRMGREEIAVPWSMVQLSPEKDRLMVQVDKEKFKNAPTFNEKSYSPEWEQEVNSYYGVEAGMAPGAEFEHGKVEKSTEKPGTAYLKSESAKSGEMKEKYEGAKTTGVMTTDELMRKAVTTQQGERVGTVRDFVIGENGRVQYLILSLEGRKGEVAVPWQLVHFGPESGMLSLTVSKDKIDNAPKFEKSDVQKLSDPEWNRHIFSYYGIEYSGMGMEKGKMHEGSMMEKAPAGSHSETQGTY
jgi:sporulation protein YlmC with PRC-barrel domain